MMDLMEIISETLRVKTRRISPYFLVNCRDNFMLHSCPCPELYYADQMLPFLSHSEVLQININDKTGKKLINFPQIFQLAAEGLPSFRNCLAEFFNVQSGLSSTGREGMRDEGGLRCLV